MKKTFPLVIIFLALSKILNSQTTELKGKALTEIFTDFHVNINDTSQTTGFGFNRAYFGYNFFPDNNFSALIILNAGNPDDIPAASVHRRYAYLREASVSYTRDKLHISFGITSTKHFEYQQKFLGKRYVANTFQALNGFGYVADLGVVLEYKFSDIISGDISVLNGEGYSELQIDNGVKSAAGLTLTPSERLSVRVYGDINRQNGMWQYTFTGFAGYRNDLITIGAETNYKSNLLLTAGTDAWGLSGTGSVRIFSKSEIFARYDFSSAAIEAGDYTQWNLLNDGNFMILGLQHIFSPNVKVALDYQERIPREREIRSTGMLCVNASFKFR
jgi:hypothetical protein